MGSGNSYSFGSGNSYSSGFRNSYSLGFGNAYSLDSENSYSSLTVYVDDTGIEAAGSDMVVKHTLVGATTYFVNCLEGVGMEFSPTKNCCLASSLMLSKEIIKCLPMLKTHATMRAKSLGGALGTGGNRNATVQKKRLKQFQKLRRTTGARRSHLVLRTGGTAALVYRRRKQHAARAEALSGGCVCAWWLRRSGFDLALCGWESTRES